MAVILNEDDLPQGVRDALNPLTKAIVDGLNARASRVAPCLDATTDEGVIAEARLVLLGAIKRWAETGSGAYSQQTTGPYSVSIDTRQRTGYNLWPSEVEALQAICRQGPSGRQAFSIDTAPAGPSAHLPWCDVMFGRGSCSCGVDIAGEPIYELQ